VLGQILEQTLNPVPCCYFQRSDKPTRRVYVTRDLEGDREFAGFAGEGDAGSFAGTVVVSSV
jgi:hypothetical protein